MKIISFLHAVSTLHAPWEEVRPIAGEPYAVTAKAIKDRYQFQVASQSLLGQQSGLALPSFATGQFTAGEQTIVINQIEFQPTGILVSSPKTENNLLIFDDLFSFLQSTLKFRPPPKARKMTNVTTLISQFDSGIDKMFGKWMDVQSVINSMAADEAPLAPLGIRMIGFRNEEPVLDRQFIFERRVPAPSGENWIFSQAPLDTEKHVKVLEKVESVFQA